MRVAVLNGTDYEVEQHAPIALAEGITQEQIYALGERKGTGEFPPIQWDVLRLTDTMTTKGMVPREQMAVLRRSLSNEQLLELVTKAASYNIVLGFLEALDIQSADQGE
jgi:alkylhydroperoxidase family enzyme